MQLIAEDFFVICHNVSKFVIISQNYQERKSGTFLRHSIDMTLQYSFDIYKEHQNKISMRILRQHCKPVAYLTGVNLRRPPGHGQIFYRLHQCNMQCTANSTMSHFRSLEH